MPGQILPFRLVRLEPSKNSTKTPGHAAEHVKVFLFDYTLFTSQQDAFNFYDIGIEFVNILFYGNMIYKWAVFGWTSTANSPTNVILLREFVRRGIISQEELRG